MKLPQKPPATAPRKSDGAKTPPDPPEPSVRDVAAIFGIGFSPNTGGPFSFLDRQDLRALVSELEGFAETHGERYAPPQLLRDMAEKQAKFHAN